MSTGESSFTPDDGYVGRHYAEPPPPAYPPDDSASVADDPRFSPSGQEPATSSTWQPQASDDAPGPAATQASPWVPQSTTAADSPASATSPWTPTASTTQPSTWTPTQPPAQTPTPRDARHPYTAAPRSVGSGCLKAFLIAIVVFCILTVLGMTLVWVILSRALN